MVTRLSLSQSSTICPRLLVWIHLFNNPICKSLSMCLWSIIFEEEFLDCLIFKSSCIETCTTFSDSVSTTDVFKELRGVRWCDCWFNSYWFRFRVERWIISMDGVSALETTQLYCILSWVYRSWSLQFIDTAFYLITRHGIWKQQ